MHGSTSIGPPISSPVFESSTLVNPDTHKNTLQARVGQCFERCCSKSCFSTIMGISSVISFIAAFTMMGFGTAAIMHGNSSASNHLLIAIIVCGVFAVVFLGLGCITADHSTFPRRYQDYEYTRYADIAGGGGAMGF